MLIADPGFRCRFPGKAFGDPLSGSILDVGASIDSHRPEYTIPLVHMERQAVIVKGDGIERVRMVDDWDRAPVGYHMVNRRSGGSGTFRSREESPRP